MAEIRDIKGYCHTGGPDELRQVFIVVDLPDKIFDLIDKAPTSPGGNLKLFTVGNTSFFCDRDRNAQR